MVIITVLFESRNDLNGLPDRLLNNNESSTSRTVENKTWLSLSSMSAYLLLYSLCSHRYSRTARSTMLNNIRKRANEISGAFRIGDKINHETKTGGDPLTIINL